MPAPTVTVLSPPPAAYTENILRPAAYVKWSGGVGPFNVVHEWDTVSSFDSPNLITDTNNGATSPDTGVPDADMGPTGTTWFYRVTVTDTDDSASAGSSAIQLEWFDPVALDRYLYLLANAGVGFDPTDTPGFGWGPAPDGAPVDGFTIDFNRYLYLLANAGVGFDPTDATDWGVGAPGDGDAINDLHRYLYLLANAGVGFDPTDATDWGPDGAPGDGFTIDFNRYLYALAYITDNVPTPHIWYVYPDFGREGWEFKVVGYGFGDTQATYNGAVLLNALGASIVDWTAVESVGDDHIIDPTDDIATPTHQQVRAVVPVDAESGLIFITTDA